MPAEMVFAPDGGFDEVSWVGERAASAIHPAAARLDGVSTTTARFAPWR